MVRFLMNVGVWFAVLAAASPRAMGQMAGSRAGVQADAGRAAALPPLSPEIARGYITVEGRAVLRARPTEIRIVLAVTAEGETAAKKP